MSTDSIRQTSSLLGATFAREIADRSLASPQPQPRQPSRHRLVRVERPAPGLAYADVVNERTGEMRRFRFKRDDAGDLAMEEL
jgi:hypothetical protein